MTVTRLLSPTRGSLRLGCPSHKPDFRVTPAIRRRDSDGASSVRRVGLILAYENQCTLKNLHFDRPTSSCFQILTDHYEVVQSLSFPCSLVYIRMSARSSGWDFSSSADDGIENVKKDRIYSRSASRVRTADSSNLDTVWSESMIAERSQFLISTLLQARTLRRYSFNTNAVKKLPTIKHFDLRLSPRTTVSSSNSAPVDM